MCPPLGRAGPQPLQLFYSLAGLFASSVSGLQSFLLASGSQWEALVNEAEAHMRCILLLELFSVFSLKELGYFLGFLGFLILEAAIAVTSREERKKERGEGKGNKTVDKRQGRRRGERKKAGRREHWREEGRDKEAAHLDH